MHRNPQTWVEEEEINLIIHFHLKLGQVILAAHLFGWPCKLQHILVCCNIHRRNKIFGKQMRRQNSNTYTNHHMHLYMPLNTLLHCPHRGVTLQQASHTEYLFKTGLNEIPCLRVHRQKMAYDCTGSHLPAKVIKRSNLISKRQTGKISLKSTSNITLFPLTFR